MKHRKKICLFLHRRFTPLGHAMACHIKHLCPETEFCAYVSTRQSLELLTAQKDILYTSLLLEEDIHKTLYGEKIDMAYLRSLEREYGIPNLWPYLYVDRVIMSGQLVREYPHDTPLLSHANMLKKLQVTAKAIISFLEGEKPDVVLTAVIGTTGSMLLYHIAKKKGIQSVHMEFARIGNRIALTEDYRTFTWVRKKFKKIQDEHVSPARKEAEEFLHAFRASPAHYDEDAVPGFYERAGRGANLRFLRPENLLYSIPWHMQKLFRDLKRVRNPDYNDIFIWWELWDKIKRRVRGLIGYEDLYSPMNWDDRFAYYPLHIEPEVATLLYGPFYTNQLEIIRATARSLPVGMVLYVKEHPGMVGYRTRQYYKEILKIPNVHLISPRISGLELARAASLTVTITSTNAWESILFKKPVITFGDVFFNDIPGVLRCRSFEDLPYLVKRQLEEWRHDEEVLVHYVSALLEDSVAVDFSALWNRAAPLPEILADAGMKELSYRLLERITCIKKH